MSCCSIVFLSSLIGWDILSLVGSYSSDLEIDTHGFTKVGASKKRSSRLKRHG